MRGDNHFYHVDKEQSLGMDVVATLCVRGSKHRLQPVRISGDGGICNQAPRTGSTAGTKQDPHLATHSLKMLII